MRYRSKKQLVDDILALEQPINVSTHDDADGIAAAVLFGEFLTANEREFFVDFPENFGYCSSKTDVVLDQVPMDLELDAIVLDHHSQHLGRRTYDYKLWYEEIPTTRMVYDLFKRQLQHKWKVAIGVVGDGQPEQIPDEIWDQYPELFQEKCSLYTRGYEITVYRNPLYFMLSSGINAISRMEDQKNDQLGPAVAYNIAKDVKDPWELVNHSMCDMAKALSKKEEKRILANYVPLDLGKAVLWVIETDYSLCSLMATRLQSTVKKTVIAVNRNDGRISIRGDQAGWVRRKLPDFAIDGHSKWMGGVLDDDQTPEDLRSALVAKIR